MSELHPTPVPRWAQVTPAETPSLRSLTTLAVSVVIVAALYFGREVLIPITLAILLSFVQPAPDLPLPEEDARPPEWRSATGAVHQWTRAV